VTVGVPIALVVERNAKSVTAPKLTDVTSREIAIFFVAIVAAIILMVAFQFRIDALLSV